MIDKTQQEKIWVSWYDVALGELGTHEWRGEADNPEVIKYFEGIDDLSAKMVRNDETSWCSAFVNWCFERSKIDGTKSAVARSWLRWGRAVDDPYPGCVVVFWRDSRDSWQGHVGFHVWRSEDKQWCLGGNQGNEVSVKGYPRSRVLGYREPIIETPPWQST